MKNPDDLSQQMRADWDRRITHDYRFWMSDGHSSDQAMWDAGERDLTLLLEGYAGNSSEKTILDLGCGVGRLLKSALNRFGKVIGLDVSEKAIEKSRELLGVQPTLQLHVTDGLSLQPVQNASVDVVACFAVLGSVPAHIFANYLIEMNRVLRPGGEARLQIYIGKPQNTSNSDTLYLRAYEEDRLDLAFSQAGFTNVEFRELVLPFKVSSEELGFKAVFATIKKATDPKTSAEVLTQVLLPDGEAEDSEQGHELEYWMSVNYAQELFDKGDLDRAKETLRYAAQVAHTNSIDAQDLLQRITAKAAALDNRPVLWDLNLAQLRQRFPKVAERLEKFEVDQKSFEIKDTAQGRVLVERGQCLDHPEKPLSAATAWASRLLQDASDERHPVIFGAGFWYHLEAITLKQKRFSVLEPSLTAFSLAMRERPIDSWLAQVDYLQVGPELVLPEVANLRIELRPQTQALYSEEAQKVRSQFYGKQGMSLLHPTIGVLGPLHGGTLPIMAYSNLTFQAMNQRSRQYDVSCFDQGYLNLEQFVKDKLRRGPVESMYYEMVSQVILEGINEKPIDILFCMALAPISPRVLTELRGRGVLTVLWFVEDYKRFKYWEDTARYFDFVFTIQKDKCIEAIKGAGAGEVHYLPVACEPHIHAPNSLSDEEKAKWGSPISFMGSGYHNRQQIFAALADFPIKIWGTEWPEVKPFDRMVQEGGRRLTPGEYIKIFNATDININLHSSAERDGVDPFGDFLNPRTFELASAGAFQLVDERTLLPEAFEVGKEIITFSDINDLKAKINYYLAHPEERRAVAERARARALRDHTYERRLTQMLSVIYSSKYEQLKARQDASPWIKTIERSKRHEELHERCERAFTRGEEPTLDGLVSDIVTGKGKLTDTEKKLLFLFHLRKQIIRMGKEDPANVA